MHQQKHDSNRTHKSLWLARRVWQCLLNLCGEKKVNCSDVLTPAGSRQAPPQGSQSNESSSSPPHLCCENFGSNQRSHLQSCSPGHFWELPTEIKKLPKRRAQLAQKSVTSTARMRSPGFKRMYTMACSQRHSITVYIHDVNKDPFHKSMQNMCTHKSNPSAHLKKDLWKKNKEQLNSLFKAWR